MQVTHISRVGGNLQIRKEDVRANVFKPTVALPTMTVEEFGEIELERARTRQVRGGLIRLIFRRQRAKPLLVQVVSSVHNRHARGCFGTVGSRYRTKYARYT